MNRRNCEDELKDIDWENFNFDVVTQEDIDQLEGHILTLTSRYTKRELEDESLRRGIRLSAVNNMKDLYESDQLKFRKSLKEVEYPEIPDVITCLGQLFISNGPRAEIKHRAPLIGEHNQEIYQGELGFDSKTMDSLKAKGII